MTSQPETTSLCVGYLMQNGAPDLDVVSGPQLHTLAVINGLKKLGHTVRVLANQKKRLGWTDDLKDWKPPKIGWTRSHWFRAFESMIRRIQTELHLPYLGIFDSLHFADTCSLHLRNCNILYERHGYMGFGGVIASLLLGIPLIIELNGNIVKEIDERGLDISSLQRYIGRWITIQTLRAANRIVVVSDALKETLVKDYRIPEKKISIVLNGVNLELFLRDYDKKLIQRQFGLSNNPIITFVGSFNPWHGVDLLVSSFSELQKRHPDTQLILVGDGSGRETAVRQTIDLGLNSKVKFLGRLPQYQVAAILSVSKILVAPYPFEYDDIVGTPLKLIEYMAAGKGIIASKAAIHEIIEDGVTGLRVNPANVKALTDGINMLLVDDELCAYLGQNAKKNSHKYSWDQVCIRLAQLFVEEISNKHDRSG